ncbi:MAG: VCBS repeat-containing protein [Sandaracinaceae bacterium]|nr:VCBS repeat-containing protein [Sandaracinaceae bacterium]
MDKVFASLRTFGVLLGLWVILVVVGIVFGVLPIPGLTPDADPTADGGVADADGGVDADDAGARADAAAPDAGTEPPEADVEPPPEEVAPAAPVAEAAARWSVCEGSADPSLAVLDAFGDARPEIVVGCREGWHVLGMSATGPSRIARFLVAAPPADQQAIAGPMARGDVDGDGTGDLVMPLAYVGDHGASRGGGLFWIPRDSFGGIREPALLAPITAVSAIVAAVDGETGGEIVAMNRANALAQLASEVWIFGGGASPTRAAALVTGLNGSAVAVMDADRDGHPDVVALADGRVDLHFGDGAGAFPRNHTLELPGARELGYGDVDGDGGADLVVLANDLRWIRAGALDGMEPHGIDGVPVNLRGLQVLDADGDGAIDLLGWDHPRLMFLRQREPVDFEPRTAFTLAGGPFGPRRHRVADLDGDGTNDDLVLLGTTAEEGAPLEIVVLLDALEGAELTPSDEARPVPDAPLVLTATLR